MNNLRAKLWETLQWDVVHTYYNRLTPITINKVPLNTVLAVCAANWNNRYEITESMNNLLNASTIIWLKLICPNHQ